MVAEAVDEKGSLTESGQKVLVAVLVATWPGWLCASDHETSVNFDFDSFF